MAHDKSKKVAKPRGRIACQDPNKTDKAGRTKIFSSTSSGSLEKVKDLVERGADVNHRDNAGWAPLHEAALKGQYEIAEYLIQAGAIVNVRGFEDDTPLHDACSYGYADCVKLLVESGADVYALNTDKQRPIDLCDDKACIKIVKAKMKELDHLASRDNRGRTALHRACCEGDIDKAASLLKKGVNTNATDKDNWTPLHYAAQHGHLEIAKLLIQHGADMNSLGHQGLTTLHVACKHGHEDIAQHLVDAGVDVHAVDSNGQTPYQVSESIAVRQIITARIDQERRLRATTEAIDEITFVSNTKQKRKINDSSASTPSSTNATEDETLLSREERKIQAIMKAFEKAEQKKQAKRAKKDDDRATTPVHNNTTTNTNENNLKKRKSPSRQSRPASRECSVDSQKKPSTAVLDTSKLDPHKKDTSGRTHLHRWSIRGNTQAVESLLKAGANPCERDNAGYTPLHEAALRGKTKVVQLLLESDADVNCKGADLDTPLHDATENGFADVVQLLLDYGADTLAKNAKGQTSLEIAVELENSEIESILRKHKDTKPKKRKLVLAANLETSKQPESPTSPVGTFDMSAKKAHARQLSGQHLPKKSLKPHLVKNEVPPDGPHTPIPTPPPEHWQKVVKKEEEDSIRLSNSEALYPSIHCASRYLPLYTIQLLNEQQSNLFFVVDLQISLLLGISIFQLTRQYPHLQRRQISSIEKERLWSPLSSMICSNSNGESNRLNKDSEKQKFLATDIYFVRLDQIVSIIKEDYSHLSESLITITLDIGYTPSLSSATDGASIPSDDCIKSNGMNGLAPTSPTATNSNNYTYTTNSMNSKQNVKLPPKFAMKMKKCGMLKFDNKNSA
ncbi:ankyrin repeat-containing domain protein [Mucor lusitanicus]|uniref:Ankyrin repeat-containing domain protein n=2 Tax=Mucor circinelloides f. lusitanicus TaxID=29924 RepID=A0A8H4EZG5_MUCCL|nr:ankyrin repeat-containing domain protein [Mucor lusitanicus]